jgi:hypothetical protein
MRGVGVPVDVGDAVIVAMGDGVDDGEGLQVGVGAKVGISVGDGSGVKVSGGGGEVALGLGVDSARTAIWVATKPLSAVAARVGRTASDAPSASRP